MVLATHRTIFSRIFQSHARAGPFILAPMTTICWPAPYKWNYIHCTNMTLLSFSQNIQTTYYTDMCVYLFNLMNTCFVAQKSYQAFLFPTLPLSRHTLRVIVFLFTVYFFCLLSLSYLIQACSLQCSPSISILRVFVNDFQTAPEHVFLLSHLLSHFCCKLGKYTANHCIFYSRLMVIVVVILACFVNWTLLL